MKLMTISHNNFQDMKHEYAYYIHSMYTRVYYSSCDVDFFHGLFHFFVFFLPIRFLLNFLLLISYVAVCDRLNRLLASL